MVKIFHIFQAWTFTVCCLADTAPPIYWYESTCCPIYADMKTLFRERERERKTMNQRQMLGVIYYIHSKFTVSVHLCDTGQ